MSEVTFLYLSQEDVIAAGGLDMAATMETIEAVLALHARGDVVQPVKPTLRWGDALDTEETRGRIMAMPAYVGGAFDVAGIKWIPSMPANPRERGLPRASALIILNDAYTGLPLAVMDGTIISAMRTGAVTGVGARHLAAPGARVAGLCGAGVQSRTQLMALRVALPRLAEARIYDPQTEKCRRWAAEMSAELNLEVTPVASAEEAVRGADVVVSATIATEPYIRPEWTKDGVLVANPSSFDLFFEVVEEADKLVVDDWVQDVAHDSRLPARMVAAGRLSRENLHAELGEVVIGVKPGRETPHEKIVFDYVGLAIEDVAAAHRVWKQAEKAGVGVRLPLWRKPHWL
ncbi:MAG: 2,3-diaminopropionate biosynthesis protein SbnB [Thermoleophilia bacterium]